MSPSEEPIRGPAMFQLCTYLYGDGFAGPLKEGAVRNTPPKGGSRPKREAT